MKSLIKHLVEGRPTGQKRYQRDTSRLEGILDKLYASGASQKKINNFETKIARRTNDGDYDVEDVNIHTTHGQLGVPVGNEDDPKVMSLDELMREKARKIYTDNHTHEMVGKEIRDSLVDLSIPTKPYEGVTDHEIGKEAHNILIRRMNLISKIRKNK